MDSGEDVWMLGIRRRPDPQKERVALLLEQQKLDLKAFLDADKHKKLTTTPPTTTTKPPSSSSSSSSSRSTWNPNPPLVKDNPPPLPTIQDQPLTIPQQYPYPQRQQQPQPSINPNQPFMNIQQPYMNIQHPYMNIQQPYMNQEQLMYMNQQLQLQQQFFMMQQPFIYNPQQYPQQPFTHPQKYSIPNHPPPDPISPASLPQQHNVNPRIGLDHTNHYQHDPNPPSHSSIPTLPPILNTPPIQITTVNPQEQTRRLKLEQAKVLQAELLAQIEEKRRRDVLAKQDRLTASSYTELNPDVPVYLSSSSSAPAPRFGRRRFENTPIATQPDQQLTSPATTESNPNLIPQPETQLPRTDTSSPVLAKSHLRGQNSYLPKWEQDLIEQKLAKQKLASLELQQQILEKKKAKADLISKTKELERLEMEKFNLECMNLKKEQENAEKVQQMHKSDDIQARVEARSQWSQPQPKSSLIQNLDSSISKLSLTPTRDERKIPHHLNTKPESPPSMPLKPQPRSYSPPLPAHQHGSLHLQQHPVQPLRSDVPSPIIKRPQSPPVPTIQHQIIKRPQSPPVPTLQHHRNMDETSSSQMPRSQSPPIPTLQNRNMKDNIHQRTSPEVNSPLINRPLSPPIPTLQHRQNMEYHDHSRESLQTHAPPTIRPPSPPIPTLQRRNVEGNAQTLQPKLVQHSPPIPTIQNQQSRTQTEISTTPQLPSLALAHSLSPIVPVNRPQQRPPTRSMYTTSLPTIGQHQPTVKVMELGQSRNGLGQLPTTRRQVSAHPIPTAASVRKSNEQIMAELKDLQHQLIAERDRVGKAMSPQQRQLLPSVSEFLYTSTGKPLHDNASKDAASWYIISVSCSVLMIFFPYYAYE